MIWHKASLAYLAALRRYYGPNGGDKKALHNEAEDAYARIPPSQRAQVLAREAKISTHWMRVCAHCKQRRCLHLDGRKCLFEPTEFK